MCFHRWDRLDRDAGSFGTVRGWYQEKLSTRRCYFPLPAEVCTFKWVMMLGNPTDYLKSCGPIPGTEILSQRSCERSTQTHWLKMLGQWRQQRINFQLPYRSILQRKADDDAA
jgi:hypothetical protein